MNLSNYIVHIAKSFGVHIVFGVVLALSFNFAPVTNKDKEEQPVIEAVVIDQTALNKQVAEIEKKKRQQKEAEEKRVKDLERRAEQAKQKIAQLDKAKSNSEQAAKEAKKLAQVEKEKAEKAKKERLAREKEAEKAKQAALEAKRKKEAEEKAAAEAKAKKEAEEKALKEAEAERQRKLEQERLEKERKEKEAAERAIQEKLIQEQLAREQAARQKARQKHVLTETQKYQALIKSKIQQNLLVDEKMKGKSCRLNINVAFSGLVTKVTKLSGDTVVCDAAQRAVWKAETLPVSKEPDVFQELKDIIITVEPEL